MIFLIGFMGCGKTTIAKYMGNKFGYSIIDTDEVIVNNCKKNINRIFFEDGDDFFREQEMLLIKNLKKKKVSIVATGGGLPCYNGLMHELNQMGKTIYLRKNSEQILNILRMDQNRPLILGLNDFELKKYIDQELKKREVFYLMANKIIDIDGLDIKTISREIHSFLIKS
tara:strand:+ start:534 stop:1043 length:510 start_codon:yes stop_codon:yes gene_type:complete